MLVLYAKSTQLCMSTVAQDQLTTVATACSIFCVSCTPSVVAIDPSLLVDNLGLSEETVRALKARGIASLFPIQRQVLQPAMEGTDLIGRAKTGSGKTLAFALPVVESLLAEDKARGSRKAPGRPPRCGAAAAAAIGTRHASLCLLLSPVGCSCTHTST